MPDLRDLYQEMILGHSKSPRNRRVMLAPSRTAQGFNPLCGDKVTLYVKLEGDRIADLSFEGSGCAISTAAASLMTDTLKGKTIPEAEALFQEFHDLVTGKNPPDQAPDDLGKLKVFAGVAEFPMRVKCATLVWHTLRSALAGQHETVTTE
jgi:nitrogen fixation NifU-like protein